MPQKEFSICFAHDLYDVPQVMAGTSIYITDHRRDWYLIVFKNVEEMSCALGIEGLVILIGEEIEDLKRLTGIKSL